MALMVLFPERVQESRSLPKIVKFRHKDHHVIYSRKKQEIISLSSFMLGQGKMPERISGSNKA